jgi:hypothetical protein
MKTLFLTAKEDIQMTVYSYEPPTIKLIEVSVEKGFADSTNDWTNDPWF